MEENLAAKPDAALVEYRRFVDEHAADDSQELAMARATIGDVLAAARGATVMVRSNVEPLESALIGHHGSLTDAEQLVPLLLATR